MPSNKSVSRQARINKLALRKLRDLGLFKGDLRKKPGKSAINALSKYDAVLKGRASVVQPKNPKAFKGVFDVVGKNVIVPRRKGERISIDKKTGELISKRKVGTRTVTSRGLHVAKGQKIPKPPTPKQYAIPFNKHKGGVFWQRFPTWDLLQKFMADYDYKGWENYVVEETVGKPLSTKTLNAKLKERGYGLKRKHRTRKASRAIRRSEGE